MLYDVQPSMELVGMSTTVDEDEYVELKKAIYNDIEAYKDDAVEEAYKRGYIAGSIDQVTKSEEK